MRVVLQRVSGARVRVDGSVVASIGPGLVLLVGVEPEDTVQDVRAVIDKVVNLRVFSDDAGRMNLSIGDTGGEVIVVSQFTLLGDVRRGRRPSFTGAAAPEVAAPLIDEMVEGFRQVGITTGSGTFGATMEVELVNEGPVTLVFSVRNARLS
jgi:D-tyrosyl-tRNA(Tyr) deacylase